MRIREMDQFSEKLVFIYLVDEADPPPTTHTHTYTLMQRVCTRIKQTSGGGERGVT